MTTPEYNCYTGVHGMCRILKRYGWFTIIETEDGQIFKVPSDVVITPES